jgi:hypothetical protein
VLALAGLAVVVAVGVVVLWPRTEPNRITRENCYQIKEAMSRAEVEAILGPPGDYSTGDAKCSDLPAQPMLMDLRQALSLEELRHVGSKAVLCDLSTVRACYLPWTLHLSPRGGALPGPTN